MKISFLTTPSMVQGQVYVRRSEENVHSSIRYVGHWTRVTCDLKLSLPLRPSSANTAPELQPFPHTLGNSGIRAKHHRPSFSSPIHSLPKSPPPARLPDPFLFPVSPFPPPADSESRQGSQLEFTMGFQIDDEIWCNGPLRIGNFFIVEGLHVSTPAAELEPGRKPDHSEPMARSSVAVSFGLLAQTQNDWGHERSSNLRLKVELITSAAPAGIGFNTTVLIGAWCLRKEGHRQVLKRHRRHKRKNLILSHERPYWEIDFDRNCRQSPIIRLPDELLLPIMDGLEPVDLYMVRQASFTFWHIYQGKEVKKFRRSEAISRARRTVSDKETFACHLSSYYQYTKQDEMHCSRCELPYRHLVFSAEERKKRRDVRQCIAHDGFIRLCSHLTVPFSWVWDKTRSKQADSDEARQIRYDYNVFLAAKDCRESLYALPRIFNWLRRVMVTWELPLFRIVENEAITVGFITQKLKEFQTKYGNVLCSHLCRHGITSQLLRALDPRHCGYLGGNSRIGRLVACNEARWGTRD
ncbi:uncharacterized protein CLUP02_15345 [Colletotrichum lupini]|uniref:F-box domain-containing protein n=1 Tax=Colletotrichum lupini TaxID=145971 RepID=A0A9Q8WNF9_9PEZI|nr:uncharacterized protein CLUP02_15345 [Colletotrichum lupini]UQC89814.1 hypothetical protein CLUP02_15345 [Colletotrichum lupini]